MPKFDKKIWEPIGQRLKELRADVQVDDFLEGFKLTNSFRWDRVEKGLKGLELDAVYRICEKMDLSPSWLLFGIGRVRLSKIRPIEEEERWDRTVTRLLQELKALPQPEQRRLTAIAKELIRDERVPGETTPNTEAPVARKPRGNRKINS